jgi:hypothetical protein
MRAIFSVVVCSVALANAGAQKPPAMRPLGKIDIVSTEPLRSVAAALPLRDGRVYVNDIIARRLLLFDSTLAHAVVIADTTSATSNAYGRQPGTLIRYRGDTALFIDPASLSMLVLSPAGTIARVIAIPRPDDAGSLVGGVFGTPGFDARGRLVYFTGRVGGSYRTIGLGYKFDPGDPRLIIPPEVDSSHLVRVDLAARTVDTVAAVRIQKSKAAYNVDPQGYARSTLNTHDPIPLVDDWAVSSDGSIAIVRGHDYHVDWLGADGRWTSSPKMPFDWQHLDDDRKLAIIDSAQKEAQARLDPGNAARLAAAGGTGGGGGGGASGARGGGTGGGGLQVAPLMEGRYEPADISDYMPPFTPGAVHADGDNNLWIRTSTMVRGHPVYDIVNRKGELFDRVQLPPFRTIAGFGAGVVFMAVKDSAGVVHLERARVK